MNLQKLLLAHALVTLAAGIVLIVTPALIPATIHIQIRAEEFLLCYFLGAAELGLAYLSFFGRTIKDNHALQVISKTFIAFHSVTGALELYALQKGVSSKLIGNIVLRLVIVVLFFYYGVYKNRRYNKTL